MSDLKDKSKSKHNEYNDVRCSNKTNKDKKIEEGIG